MNTQTQAVANMVEALEKLAKLGNGDSYGNSIGNDIAKEALKKFRDTQPAQEPVEWECFSDLAYYDMWAIRQVGNRKFEETIHVVNENEAKFLCAWLNSLNTHPAPAKEWVGLSYEEADGLILQYQHAPFKFVRAIEQSLKEKNEK